MESENQSEGLYEELDAFIDGLEDKKGSLIVVLHKAQELFGYLPVELQNYIAHKLELNSSKVYGVVTFYSFFSTKPKGLYKIAVCMGTACFVRNAEEILEELKAELKIEVGQTGADGMFSLDAIRCVGACGLAPVVSVNGKVYGRVEISDVKDIIEEYLVEGGMEHGKAEIN